MVLMRAMSRRASRRRDVFSSWPVARWKRRLNRSFFRLERLRRPSGPGSSRECRRTFISAMVAHSAMRATKRVLIGSLAAASVSASLAICGVDAVDLEHDAAGLDAGDPQFRRALAGAHADFGRLLRHRHVRENPDPDAAGALHVTRQRTTGSFDLPRGDPLRAPSPSGRTGRTTASHPTSQRRGCGPCAPSGTWSSLVASWRCALNFLVLSQSRRRGAAATLLAFGHASCPAPSDRARGSRP